MRTNRKKNTRGGGQRDKERDRERGRKTDRVEEER